jgi:hypothetical protein
VVPQSATWWCNCRWGWGCCHAADFPALCLLLRVLSLHVLLLRVLLLCVLVLHVLVLRDTFLVVLITWGRPLHQRTNGPSGMSNLLNHLHMQADILQISVVRPDWPETTGNCSVCKLRGEILVTWLKWRTMYYDAYIMPTPHICLCNSHLTVITHHHYLFSLVREL